MSTSFHFSYPKYLASKKLIDDRALNQHVFNTMKQHLPKQHSHRPLKILEIGAGIGTMIERLIECDLLKYSEYTAVDIQDENIRKLPDRLSGFARNHVLGCDRSGDEYQNQLVLEDNEHCISIQAVHRDIQKFIVDPEIDHSWDLIIAHAVLDILPLKASLNPLIKKLRPGSLVYFTMNYNGVTRFEPEISAELDTQIEQVYNQSMDQRPVPTGGSRTGSNLLQLLPELGIEILDSGSSDWNVQSGASGFPPDEEYFLRCILNMVYESVVSLGKLPDDQINHWYQSRIGQVRDGTLIYRTQQQDICGRKYG